MSRLICLALASVVFCFAVSLFAADAPAGSVKTGVIKSVDAAAKTFVVTLPARPLTFKVDDKTIITLDGKASTFDAAIKPDLKAAVTYSKVGEDRVASKVDVTPAPAK